MIRLTCTREAYFTILRHIGACWEGAKPAEYFEYTPVLKEYTLELRGDQP